MKKTLMLTTLFLSFVNIAFATHNVGSEFIGEGKIIEEPNIVIYQNYLAKNTHVERHNYSDPKAALYLTVTKGKVDVLLNDKELHQMNLGTVLKYQGKDFVESTAQEDSIILVTIIPSS